MKDYIHWLLKRDSDLPLILTTVPILMVIAFALIAFVLWEATNAFLRLELALLVVATLPYIYYRSTRDLCMKEKNEFNPSNHE